jgi:hypothetical protein
MPIVTKTEGGGTKEKDRKKGKETERKDTKREEKI